MGEARHDDGCLVFQWNHDPSHGRRKSAAHSRPEAARPDLYPLWKSHSSVPCLGEDVGVGLQGDSGPA
jgi:hypothetical protein